MKPITYTIQDLVANARLAYQEGRLQAQTVDMEDPATFNKQGLVVCSYSAPCAIGASMDPEAAQCFDTSAANIGWLILKNRIQILDEKTGVTNETLVRADVCGLQFSHDQWTQAEVIDKPSYEEKFDRNLRRLEERYL